MSSSYPAAGRTAADRRPRVCRLDRLAVVGRLGALLVGVLMLLPATSVHAARAAPVPQQGWTAPLTPLRVTRGFDPPVTAYGVGHRGVDLAGAPGQRVVAAAAGVVGYAGPLAGRGVVTVLHAGGQRTTYEPVTATVQVGQRVEAGQPIGTLQAGHAGCPVAACLHWGLLRGQTYLDPLAMLGLVQVRLLPLSGRRGAAGRDPPVSR